jgi:sugar diacid utilization regulator
MLSRLDLAMLEMFASDTSSAELEKLLREIRGDTTDPGELTRLTRLQKLSLAVRTQEERQRQREAGLAGLVDTAQLLAQLTDLDAVLDLVTARARLLLSTHVAYINIPDEKQGTGGIYASDGHTTAVGVDLRLPDEEHPADHAPRVPSAPLWTADYLADERFQHDSETDEAVRAEGLRAILGVPLRHQNHHMGTLYVADRNVRHFNADEIALLNSLGGLAGVAIANARGLEQATAAVTELAHHGSRAEAALAEARELAGAHQRLLEKALAGGDQQALVQQLHSVFGVGVRVSNAGGLVTASAGEVPTLDPAALLDIAYEEHGTSGPVALSANLWAAPVRAGAIRHGVVLLTTPPGRAHQGEALTRLAAQIAVVPYMLDRVAAGATGQEADELLGELLTTSRRPPQKLVSHARRLGVDLVAPHVLVVVRPEGGAQGKLASWAALYSRRLSGLKRVGDSRAVLLLPGTDPGAAAEAVHAELASVLGQPATVAAAGPVSGPASVPDGYREALRCLHAMTALGATGRAASFRELGFLGLLLADNHDVDGFIETAIGPVLEYDEQRLTELAATLSAYFETGQSPTYAAERLHVHKNTVARRLERVTELLGDDWQQPDRALEIQLALRLSKVRTVLLTRPAPPRTPPAP